ncbi:hypothetical protein HanIR_Chr03g0101891 [Helianthus annuus]|nr:hypothetical protein HanIR_Chr03g0101891 [Helianthus annuus]
MCNYITYLTRFHAYDNRVNCLQNCYLMCLLMKNRVKLSMHTLNITRTLRRGLKVGLITWGFKTQTT